MSRSVNGVEPEISCGFCVMHGDFVGLKVVFISAVSLLCKKLSVPVVEASEQSRISFKSLIMEYITMGDLCASTGKYETGSRSVGMEGRRGDIRVDAAGSLSDTLR